MCVCVWGGGGIFEPCCSYKIVLIKERAFFAFDLCEETAALSPRGHINKGADTVRMNYKTALDLHLQSK